MNRVDEQAQVAIVISKWRCFVMMMACAGVNVVIGVIYIATTGMPAYQWVPIAVALAFAMPLLSAIQTVVTAHLLRFKVVNGVLYRELWTGSQKMAVAEIAFVWNMAFVISARRRVMERGFYLPARIMLDAKNRESLSSYAKTHLPEAHPLFKMWAQ